MAEERRPGDGFGHRFGFAAFKKMRRLNNTVQVEESLPPQVDDLAELEEAADQDARRNQLRFRDLIKKSSDREKVRQQEALLKRQEQEKKEEEVKEKERVEAEGRMMHKEEESPVYLIVHGRKIKCSQMVVELSSVFKCMVASTDDTENPIPVPNFISRQIVLDLVEIIERGDTGQCAHLVLVSLSYLLDFLIAVDFLGFTEVKDTVEERVKMHINDATWKEIFHYTKDIIGLFNTTCHTIEYVCKRLQEGDTLKTTAGDKPTGGAAAEQGSNNLLSNQIAIMEQKPEARDPYEESYLDFPAVFFKVMLRSKHLLPSFKLHLLKQWVGRHPERKEDIFLLISTLPFKDFRLGEVSGLARRERWGLGFDAMEEVEEMEKKAAEEKENEMKERKEQEKASKRLRRERVFMHAGLMGLEMGMGWHPLGAPPGGPPGGPPAGHPADPDEEDMVIELLDIFEH